MFRYFPCALLLLCMPFSAVLAETKASTLAEFIKDTKTFSSKFSQRIYDEDGDIFDDTIGEFLSQKPHKYSWVTTSPDYTALISDGDNVWYYDADLEQVTVNSTKESNLTPMVLLASDIQSLEEMFEINTLGESRLEDYNYPILQIIKSCSDKDNECFEMVPKDEGGDFKAVLLSFTRKTLSKIVLVDHLQNSTVVEFLKPVRNIDISPESFKFVIPKNVDVIRNN